MSKLGIFAAGVATGAIATLMLKGVIDEIDNMIYSPLNSDLSPTAAGDETVPNNRPSEGDENVAGNSSTQETNMGTQATDK